MLLLWLSPSETLAGWGWRAGARAKAAKETIIGVAESYSMEPAVLVAVCGCETQLQAIRGGTDNEMWGACQVSLDTWDWLLLGLGIYEVQDQFLGEGGLEPGLEAGAAVLAYKRIVYGETLDLTLCLYGVGGKAHGFKKDCGYSKRIVRSLQHAHRALW